MSGKRLNAKYKIDRRQNINLWGRPKSPHNKRQTPPGQHGPTLRRKISDYGNQLFAKQRLKTYYGNISEKKFASYYRDALKKKGDTSQNLIGILESRLDAVIYKAKFTPTPFSARQLINHGHVMVNGKKVTIPSYMLRVGDEVSLKDKAKQIPFVIEAVNSPERDVPEYIEVDFKNYKAKYLKVPALEDVPYPVDMEPNLVVEFYSR
jgi:small subunit ribosomal protein S4